MKRSFLLLFIFPVLLSAQQGSYAVSFDGTSGYIAIPHNSVFNVSKVTIEMWIYWGNCGGSGDIDFLFAKAIEQLEIHTAGGAANNGFRFIPTAGVYLDTPLGSFTASAWHHVAFMYDPSISFAQCRIDGTVVPLTSNGSNPLSTALTSSANDIRIGRRGDGSYPFCGKIDEVRIWNTIRTSAEISANKDKELTGSETGLAAYYKMNEGAGTTLADAQDNHYNNGTLMSGASWAAVTGPTYLNFRNVDGSTKYVPVTSLRKITFDGTAAIATMRGGDVAPQSFPFTALQSMKGSSVSAGTLLPVELASFSARAMQHTVELSWMTATEVNNAGFEIQRRIADGRLTIDNGQWAMIGFVEGHGTTNAPQSYSFTDKPGHGTFLYRLKQIDRDGKFEYSETIEAVAGGAAGFALGQNYPNPFNPSTMINYSIAAPASVTLKVYDVLGAEVATLVNGFKEAGNYSATFNASALANGVYLYKLQAGQHTDVKRLTVMK